MSNAIRREVFIKFFLTHHKKLLALISVIAASKERLQNSAQKNPVKLERLSNYSHRGNMRESKTASQFSPFHAPLGDWRKNALEQYLKSGTMANILDRISVPYWQVDLAQVEWK